MRKVPGVVIPGQPDSAGDVTRGVQNLTGGEAISDHVDLWVDGRVSVRMDKASAPRQERTPRFRAGL